VQFRLQLEFLLQYHEVAPMSQSHCILWLLLGEKAVRSIPTPFQCGHFVALLYFEFMVLVLPYFFNFLNRKSNNEVNERKKTLITWEFRHTWYLFAEDELEWPDENWHGPYLKCQPLVLTICLLSSKLG